jgi:hypothetical protein
MPTSRKWGPEGGHRKSDQTGATPPPTDEPGTRPQEDDVEGHNFGHNSMLSRNAAQSREREVQRNLKQHDLKSEARRPFLKGR